MFDDFDGRPSPKEFGKWILGAGRLYRLLRQECGIEPPSHNVVLAVCSFEDLYIKDGWEYMLTNRKDVEDTGRLFEQGSSRGSLKKASENSRSETCRSGCRGTTRRRSPETCDCQNTRISSRAC